MKTDPGHQARGIYRQKPDGGAAAGCEGVRGDSLSHAEADETVLCKPGAVKAGRHLHLAGVNRPQSAEEFATGQ